MFRHDLRQPESFSAIERRNLSADWRTAHHLCLKAVRNAQASISACVEGHHEIHAVTLRAIPEYQLRYILSPADTVPNRSNTICSAPMFGVAPAVPR
jgi:hypothetical protein